MDNLKGTSKVLGALLVGALVGTAVGILFAPEKGTKTREKIAGSSKKMAKDLKQKVTDEVKNFKKKASKLEKLTEEKFTELKNSLLNDAESIIKK